MKWLNNAKQVRIVINALLAVIGIILLMLLSLFLAVWFAPDIIKANQKPLQELSEVNGNKIAIDELWRAPDESTLPEGREGDQIRYGKELIKNTSVYLGPKGSVLAMSNGMNCQNCHLDAGTKPYGNNFSAVAANYPKYHPRSGTTQSIEERINGCFERSLNGSSLAYDSPEMHAMVAYINWLGKDVPKGTSPKGAGLFELEFLNRAANPETGKIYYEKKCKECHGLNGEGVLSIEEISWVFPPLWGEHSYNTGAGLYRVSRFAAYIKTNMPLNASHEKPLLSDEEAWDIAAYVNSLPHPLKDISRDWPDISKKPVDHPFGPFHDGFSETQHKFGPFIPIVEERKTLELQ